VNTCSVAQSGAPMQGGLMETLQLIPGQVYFLIALAAVLVLLADTAVRSWHSPERVADPSYMWPRPAPARANYFIGPRLPGGSFRMPEAGLRLAWGNGGSFFQDTEMHPAPELDTAALRDGYRLLADDRVHAMINGRDPRPLSVDPVHLGATEEWSPMAEHEAATAARLPLDDVDEWLAERTRQYEHELSRIGCRTVSLVKGEVCRTVDDELQAFVDGSQQLHAYREMRIGNTQELGSKAMLRELLRV
jgi:hypothetical protein